MIKKGKQTIENALKKLEKYKEKVPLKAEWRWGLPDIYYDTPLLMMNVDQLVQVNLIKQADDTVRKQIFPRCWPRRLARRWKRWWPTRLSWRKRATLPNSCTKKSSCFSAWELDKFIADAEKRGQCVYT